MVKNGQNQSNVVRERTRLLDPTFNFFSKPKAISDTQSKEFHRVAMDSFKHVMW